MQTNDKMIEVINAVAETLKNNQSVPLNKMPVLAQEIINYAVVSNMIGTLMAVAAAFAITVMFENSTRDSKSTKEERSIVAFIWWTGITSAIMLSLMFGATCLKAMAQPNLYVMQKVAEMQKVSP